MTLAEIIIAIFMALLIGLLFYYVFKVTGPWGSFWGFIGILILAGLAAEAWVEPIGPTIYGAPWVSALIVIFLFALLIAAASPAPRDRERMRTRQTAEITEPESTGAVAFGIFFWLFLVIMLIVAIWGFVYTPEPVIY